MAGCVQDFVVIFLRIAISGYSTMAMAAVAPDQASVGKSYLHNLTPHTVLLFKMVSGYLKLSNN